MNYKRIQVKLSSGKEMTFLLDGKRLRNAKCDACKSGAFFEYMNNEVRCPHCGRTLEVVKTPEEFEKEQAEKEKAIEKERLNNLHLIDCGMDYSTGIRMYCLSTKVDPDTWMKIRGFFNFYNRGWDDENDADFLGQTPTGWLTTMPGEVEKILMDLKLIKKENTLYMREERAAKRRAEEKRRRKIKEEARTKAIEIKKELRGIFDEAEKPYQKELLKDGKNYRYKTKNLMEYEDVLIEVVEDPLQSRGSYFGGIYFVICKEHIWIISENDNWMCHNIQVISDNREIVGAGKRVPYSEEVKNKIKKYENIAKKATH